MAVPAINAGRVAGQTASRMGPAKGLTGAPDDVLAEALASRAASKGTKPAVSGATQVLIKTLAMRGIASQEPRARRHRNKAAEFRP